MALDHFEQWTVKECLRRRWGASLPGWSLGFLLGLWLEWCWRYPEFFALGIIGSVPRSGTAVLGEQPPFLSVPMVLTLAPSFLTRQSGLSRLWSPGGVVLHSGLTVSGRVILFRHQEYPSILTSNFPFHCSNCSIGCNSCVLLDMKQIVDLFLSFVESFSCLYE